MSPLIQLKATTLPFLATFVLACLGLSPTAQAIPERTPPPQKPVEGDLGNHNTVEGNGLSALTTGTDNTAMGFDALFFNTTGFHNTATGSQALKVNNDGFSNTAIGFQALLSNTTGVFNTAVGVQALSSNIGSGDNTAVGYQALFSHAVSVGFDTDNTAVGSQALFSNTFGFCNTAIGRRALFRNTTGIQNTAIGSDALGNNTGSFNIALGINAGFFLTTGDNNIDIGNSGAPGESTTIRIGDQGTQTATFIAGISGTTVVGGSAVFINGFGQLGVGGVATSSARFKDEIKPMDKTSEAILALKPVTFRYKKELDPKGIPQFGLVAEEVEKVNPDLITRDRDGKPYTVRYEVVNAMLLNEFLKEHRKVEQQDRRLEQQERTIAKQQKQIEALTAGLQKVSTQLEANKSALQLVADNH